MTAWPSTVEFRDRAETPTASRHDGIKMIASPSSSAAC